MSREFVMLRGREFLRLRHLTQGAQWLYQHLHLQAELTLIGTLAVNVTRWAIAARGLHLDEINRELAELVDAKLVLVDSSTQELWITGFFEHGPKLANGNHVRAACRALRCIESPVLARAIYEAAPKTVRDGMGDPIEMPSQGHDQAHRDDMTGYVYGDGDGDGDTRAVFQAIWQQSGAPRINEKDQESSQWFERVEGAVIELARRRVAETPKARELKDELQQHWDRYGKRLQQLASDYPDWTAHHLADAIDRGPFGG